MDILGGTTDLDQITEAVLCSGKTLALLFSNKT
jgi:hypothetical protein